MSRRADRVHHASMRARRAWLLWLLAWCGPLLMLAAGALYLGVDRTSLPDQGGSGTFENIYPNVVFGALVPLLGALILSRLPTHAVGWLFLSCGLASALTLAVYPVADVAHAHHPGLGVAAAWVSEWIWGLGLIPLVTLGVLLFPDGRPPGPRWRPLLVADTVAVVLVFSANAFHPGRLENHAAIHNPLGLDLPQPVFGAIRAVGMGLFLVGFLGGAVSPVLRWRRARGAERAQLSWFALSVATLPVALLLPLPIAIRHATLAVAVPLVPLSVAVAILRRNLYSIEVVVRRSLLYAALTTVLLLGYAVVVTVVGSVLGDRGTQAAALVATAFVAIAFAPVRARLQGHVDWMLYGDRGDPYAVLTDLGRRLGGSQEDGDPMAEIAETVASSLRLPYVRVEVDREGEDPLVGAHGRPVAGTQELPLSFRDEQIGRLLVAPRTPRDPFRPADLRLLDDLSRQIGVAARAMRLAAALQSSRESLVGAREEERRRIRRDLHDGLGPALAGVALGLDAVHRLAAEHPEEAAALADQLKLEVQASLADVRRLVEDLRPPALDQLGLVGAVRQQARALSERDPGLEVSVEAEGVGELPAAVEVAAYRIATEALTNVSRHASARRCQVGISLNGNGVLRLEIEDDGVGLAADRRHGVGLAAMRERAAELGGRCEAGAASLGGTRVSALLPAVGG